MKKVFLYVLAALCLFTAPRAALAEEVYELSYSHLLSSLHPVSKAIVEWGKKLEQDSNGQIVVHIYDNSSLMKPAEYLPAMRAGGLDIGLIYTSGYFADFPHLAVHSLPFVAQDSRDASKLYWEMMQTPEGKEEIEKVGYAITGWSSDRSCLASIGAPILKPEDLKGKRVLVWGAPTAEEVKAWGGVPVLIPTQDTYVALQRGMGEVLYGQIPVLLSLKLQEVIKNITIMPSQFSANVVIISKQTADSLPPEILNLILASGGAEESARLSKIVYGACQKDLETLKAAGIGIHELTDAQMEAFKKISVDTMTAYWLEIFNKVGKTDGKAWIEKVYSLSDKIQ